MGSFKSLTFKSLKAASIALASIILLAAASLFSASAGSSGHMKLLAVTETPEGALGGSVADLYLEVEAGKGRVFIDTRPASKLDTQMSTRLARSLGCNYLGVPCESYDFFYTITSESSIVGGPSASAAVAVLTAAVLADIPIKEDIAITGTISSGYLIGPVGGLEQKIDAAAVAGIHRVLIPSGERFVEHNDTSLLLTTLENGTLDLAEYGKEKGVDVVEVGTLDDAFFEFTGARLRVPHPDAAVDKRYQEVMEFIAKKLCERSQLFRDSLAREGEQGELADTAMQQNIEEADNLTIKGRQAIQEGAHYSGASYCFGANVQYRQLSYQQRNMPLNEVNIIYHSLRRDLQEFNDLVSSQDIETMTDLQAFMIVKERIVDADEVLDEVRQHAADRKGNITLENLYGITSQLAYARERLNSAIAWSKFFNQPGETFRMDDDGLQASCKNKLLEADEYYQYLNVVVPGYLDGARKQIDLAMAYQNSGFYELCLFKAALAKAQLNLVLSLIGVAEENFGQLLDSKLEAARQTIAEQQAKNIFPILGYSYYEYAMSLKDEDEYSALLYAEYALEFGNLDMYFEMSSVNIPSLSDRPLVMFVIGMVMGIGVSAVIFYGVCWRGRASSQPRDVVKKRRRGRGRR